MSGKFSIPEGKEPLIDYPWKQEADNLFQWVKGQTTDTKCFAFDLLMSLAFIDTTSGLSRFLQHCPNSPPPYNLHLGFINLCSPCYENANKWTYQKAAKPQSGSLGKITSEVILRFIDKTSTNLKNVRSIGGVNSIDAVLEHNSGKIILAEVKSAPLITYPVLFNAKGIPNISFHETPDISTSQFLELDSALYLHDSSVISLGKPKDSLWPFKSAIDYITHPSNKDAINSAVTIWSKAKSAYSKKDRNDSLYYLANACGRPPRIAIDRDGWPQSESISDGKTSAGMDRTDDIKKGIYQALKIGTTLKDIPNAELYKTAIISNLPAYRHKNDYVTPFLNILWGVDDDLKIEGGKEFITRDKLRRIFDYIITIDDPFLRELDL